MDDNSKILFLAANPRDTARLSLDAEIREILGRIRGAEQGRRFTVASELALRAQELPAALMRHQPDIVHFSGHGTPDGALCLIDDATRRTQELSADQLVDIFRPLGSDIRCVVLSACYSAIQAQAIVSCVPCVVGMSRVVKDAAASAFSAGLDGALAFGKSVHTAFELGRVQMGLLSVGDPSGAPSLNQSRSLRAEESKDEIPREKDIPQLLLRKDVDPTKLVLLAPAPRPDPWAATLQASQQPIAASLTAGGVTKTMNLGVTHISGNGSTFTANQNDTYSAGSTTSAVAVNKSLEAGDTFISGTGNVLTLNQNDSHLGTDAADAKPSAFEQARLLIQSLADALADKPLSSFQKKQATLAVSELKEHLSGRTDIRASLGEPLEALRLHVVNVPALRPQLDRLLELINQLPASFLDQQTTPRFTDQGVKMDATSATPSEKRALIIGINKYPKIFGRQLHGAVLDAQGYKSLLEQRFGFASSEISLLLDEQATRDAILAEIDGMVAWGAAGSQAVIIYCGHGRQIGDLESDEDDTKDETLVPYDSGNGVDNCDIRDDELWHRIVALNERGVMVTTVLDSCHSGSATRDPAMKSVRTLPVDFVPNFSRASSTNPAQSRKLQLRRDRIHLAACRDDQVAGEIQVVENNSVVWRGAFSYHLQRLLASVPTIHSWRSVFDSIFAEMLTFFPKQQPHCEGLLQSAIFSRQPIKPGQRMVTASAALTSVGAQLRNDTGVSVFLWRLPPGGDWLPIAADDMMPTFDAGDCLSLTLVNAAPTAVYLQVLRLDCGGELELIYPLSASESLPLPDSIELFRRSEDRIQLVLPEEVRTEKSDSTLGESLFQETLQIVVEQKTGARHVLTVPFLIRRPATAAPEP